MLKCCFTLSISLKHSFESNCPRNVAPLSSNQLYILSKQRLPTCLPAYLPTCLPAFLPSCLPTYLPTYVPAYLPTYLLAFSLKSWKRGKIMAGVWCWARERSTPRAWGTSYPRGRGRDRGLAKAYKAREKHVPDMEHPCSHGLFMPRACFCHVLYAFASPFFCK